MVTVSKPFVIATGRNKPSKTIEAADVAARYFVYKLYDAAGGHPELWHPIRGFRETVATVSRAVERGLVVVRDEGTGRVKQTCAVLTDQGRLLARKGLR